MADAQLRLMQARARRAEILAGAEEGRYLPTDETVAVWEGRFIVLRSRLLAIAPRVAAQVPLAVRAQVAEILEHEIYAALAELSGVSDDDVAPVAPPLRKGNGRE